MADSLSTNASSDGHTVELPQAPSRDSKRGRPFGDYMVEREVARGGMGIVYRATRKDTGQVVALKIIKQGPQASPRQVRRFQRETEAARILEHPGIVRIYEIGCCEGYHFYTMELVEGESLYALLKRKTRLEVEAVIDLVARSAEAAHYAHEMGVVHRDLKPANILLTPEGLPKLTDFGLAKKVSDKSHLRRTDHVVGTPYYMPPEQARGDMDLDRRADVYALGVILFELLALRVPFQGTTSMEVYQHVLNTNPPSLRELDPRVDQRLERIVYQTLAKDLADRYPTALALAEDLRRYVAGEPIVARAPAWERQRARRLRRRVALWGGLVVLASVVGLVVLRSKRLPEPSAPPPAHVDELAAETKRREAFEGASALLEGLFAAHSLEGLLAAEARLSEVEATIRMLAEGGQGWQERSRSLEAERSLAAARLALAIATAQGPAAKWGAVAERLGAVNASEPGLQVMRARALVGADELDEAGEVLDAVLAADPYAQEASLAKVELDLWRGAADQARVALKAILTQDPDSSAALELATRMALRRGVLREALSHLDTWARSAPRDANVQWLRALIAWEAGDTLALQLSLKRFSADADDPRGRAIEAAIKLLKNDWEGARAGFQAALNLDPGLASATLGLGLAQHGAGSQDAGLETLAQLAQRTDARGRWLRSRALAASARLLVLPAWRELAAGGDSPSAKRAEELLARAHASSPIAAEAFRGSLELAWLRRDAAALEETLGAARAHLGSDAVDPWAETQPDAEPGLGWLACWEGEVQRLAGDSKTARRAFAQVRSGPSSAWASAGREAAPDTWSGPPLEAATLAALPQEAPRWLGALLCSSPSVFPRDPLARLARDGTWEEVLAATRTLALAPAPRAEAGRWLGLILLGQLPPGLEDAPPIPAELRRLELGAEVLGRALDAAPVEWAEYGRALAARARGESGLALELAERDAEARPTARGWQLVAELKRDAGDAAGAQAAEQRAKSLGSQRR